MEDPIMIDARGYSCPTPLLMIQKAIKEGNNPATVEMLVDAPCAVENVSRYGKKAGYQVAVEDKGDYTKLTLTK